MVGECLFGGWLHALEYTWYIVCLDILIFVCMHWCAENTSSLSWRGVDRISKSPRSGEVSFVHVRTMHHFHRDCMFKYFCLERYINLYMYSLLHVLSSILDTIYCYIILYLLPRTNFKNGPTLLSSGGYQIQV